VGASDLPRGGIGTNKLSEARVRSAKAKEAPYKLSDGQGMYLLVQPHGARLWRLKYRHAGRERLYAIGMYPDVSLAGARAERDRARAWLREGKDPLIERRATKAATATAQALSFAAIAEEWLAKMRPRWSEAHADAQERRLQAELVPLLGDVAIADVKPAMLLEALRAIELRGAHEVAAKSRIMASQIFRYAVQTSRAETDPAALLAGALVRPPAVHRATIPLDEMPRMFEAIGAVPAERVTKLALYWLILTVARTAEMRFAPWSEIESANLWRVPADRMKMGRDHLVPLSRQAQEILAAARQLRTSTAGDALLFPGFARHGALSENALLALLARAGYFGRQTSHGFRASFSTWAHEIVEADPDVVEACLAHARGDVRAIYNRATYLSKRRELLQRWADQCSAWGMKEP
jgi:integrase